MLETNFWQDKLNSQKVIKEKKLFEELINSYNNSVKSLTDLNELNELALEEKNQIIINEVSENIKVLSMNAKYLNIKKEIEKINQRVKENQ